jgi:hypothetical protein
MSTTKFTAMQIIKTFKWWAGKRESSPAGCWIPHQLSETDYKKRYKLVWIRDQRSKDKIKGREYLHRLAWMALNRKRLPKGVVVRHVCSNKWCFNPSHLVVGTPQENRDDKRRAARPVTLDVSSFPEL